MCGNIAVRQRAVLTGASAILMGASATLSKKTFSTYLRRNSPGSTVIATWPSRNKNSSRDGFSAPFVLSKNQARRYSPMSKEEEEAEKKRVADLSEFKKDQELRKLNRDIARLTMLKGINTGEWYTIRGKYKMLAAEYGLPMMGWYAVCWLSTGAMVYTLAEVGGMDAIAILSKMDTFTGFDMVSKVDPTMGKLGIVLIVNELLEPIRLPFVVLTVKPVIDRLFPPKI